ncbi:MAG: hypothetical protein QNJ01_18220 [Desulfobacterales bacterium]|nr:hypothetical protein [Desulfobacterales bacterium]
MESIQWFVLGVLFTLCVFGFAYASLRVKAPWYAWGALIGGALLVMFGIAWAGSSFVEGMPSSGAMGLTLFCGPGIIAMTLAWRYWVAPGLKGN